MTEKYCAHCGEILVPGSKFCSGCGRPVGQHAAPSQNTNSRSNVYQPPVEIQPPYQPPVVRSSMTKKEFRKTCTNETYRKELKSSAITMYVLTVINALVAIGTNPVALVDAAIFLVLALGMHLGKSKFCAVGVLLYGIFCIAVTLATTGNIGGWLWIIAAISGIKAFGTADKEYEMIYGS